MSAATTSSSRPILPILRRHLARGARGLALWAVAMLAVLTLYLSFYETVASPGMTQVMESLPPEFASALNLDDIASGAGFAQATFFHLLGFVLLVIACTGWGAAAVGGAEEDGSLELTLSHGMGRIQYVLESAAAILVRVAFLALAVTIGVLVLNETAGLGLETPNVLAVVASWAGLGLLSGMAGLVGGALTGRRGPGVGAGAGIAVWGFFADAVASAIPDLDRLRHASPVAWVYEARPLAHGPDWAGLGLVYGLVALLLVVATVALAKRDVQA